MSRFDIRTRSGLISPIIQGQMGAYFDADALAFFARVTAAGGSLSLTEQNAVNQLVLDLKLNSIWTSLLAIYPMVGASAAACSQNLKSSSFTGTFSGGWTYASTGVTPNGTNAYFDTSLIPNTSLTFNSASFSIYSRNNFTPSSTQAWGCTSSSTQLPLLVGTMLSTKGLEGLIYSFNAPDTMVSATGQNLAAMFLTTRTSSSNAKLFRNNTQLASTTTNNQITQPTNSFLFGAYRQLSGIFNYNTFEYAFSSLGNGLSDTQAANFYTNVQTFQTSLSRNV
jgi:hypothetical protein